MNCKKTIKNTLFILALAASLCTYAQKVSDMNTMKQFIAVCQVYKQLPLYLHVGMHNTSNVQLQPEDTATSEATFYLREEGAYLRFGDFEQLVNDSMALLISNNLQRMILYADAAPVLSQVKKMAGAQSLPASVEELLKKYNAVEGAEKNGQKTISLSAKNLLPGTTWPGEGIEIIYDVKTNYPVQITSIKRDLLPVEKAFYETIKDRGDLTDKIIQSKEGNPYLVREKTIVFLYKEIRHDQSMQLPATIKNRIQKNGNGRFEPTKEYETYLLTTN